jgi:hypothetical protein
MDTYGAWLGLLGLHFAGVGFRIRIPSLLAFYLNRMAWGFGLMCEGTRIPVICEYELRIMRLHSLMASLWLDVIRFMIDEERKYIAIIRSLEAIFCIAFSL